MYQLARASGKAPSSNTAMSVSVYCGSRRGASDAFSLAARELGRLLALEGIRVVYGGVRTGLMRSLSESVRQNGGEVVGVLPRFLVNQGPADELLSDLRIVESMSERKSVMHDLSEASIMLPGGVGTQDEFWEVLATAQLGLHAKPCGILNVEGYYDSLLMFIDHAFAKGFLSDDDRSSILVSKNAQQLIGALSERVFQRRADVKPESPGDPGKEHNHQEENAR
jgi:uncharacterized protein (TIGR00730 family)